ncbi:MAG: diaminopimelate epimerase [Actinomycetota bacterium]|nr:diaminopimelate epimerase [Actinomycetota bacterium]
MGRMQLAKHHGLGNDFLVVVDLAEASPIDARAARWLCDRHRGIGADGVIRVTPGDGMADLAMELHNADGGLAETSGNGLRCMAQAVVDAGAVSSPIFTVRTGAGISHVEYLPEGAGPGAVVSVSMGKPEAGVSEHVELVAGEVGAHAHPHLQAMRVTLGNPHVVVRIPGPLSLASVDLARLGARLEAETPGGTNVHVAAVPDAPALDELVIRSWERGVGETLACGTGACASAVAAHACGLVGPQVIVHSPGGSLEVDLTGPEAVLTGPVIRVAHVEIDWPREEAG